MSTDQSAFGDVLHCIHPDSFTKLLVDESSSRQVLKWCVSFSDAIGRPGGLSNSKRCLIVSGPSGCGKSSLIHCIAKQLKVEILQLCAEDVADFGSPKDKLLEALSTRDVSGNGIVHVEGLSVGDVWLMDMIWEIMSENAESVRKPLIISTDMDPSCEELSQLRGLCDHVNCGPMKPFDLHMALKAGVAASTEGQVTISMEALDALSGVCKTDLRQHALQLQMLCGLCMLQGRGSIGLKDVTGLYQDSQSSHVSSNFYASLFRNQRLGVKDPGTAEICIRLESQRHGVSTEPARDELFSHYANVVPFSDCDLTITANLFDVMSLENSLMTDGLDYRRVCSRRSRTVSSVSGLSHLFAFAHCNTPSSIDSDSLCVAAENWLKSRRETEKRSSEIQSQWSEKLHSSCCSSRASVYLLSPRSQRYGASLAACGLLTLAHQVLAEVQEFPLAMKKEEFTSAVVELGICLARMGVKLDVPNHDAGVSSTREGTMSTVPQTNTRDTSQTSGDSQYRSKEFRSKDNFRSGNSNKVRRGADRLLSRAELQSLSGAGRSASGHNGDSLHGRFNARAAKTSGVRPDIFTLLLADKVPDNAAAVRSIRQLVQDSGVMGLISPLLAVEERSIKPKISFSEPNLAPLSVRGFKRSADTELSSSGTKSGEVEKSAARAPVQPVSLASWKIPRVATKVSSPINIDQSPKLVDEDCQPDSVPRDGNKLEDSNESFSAPKTFSASAFHFHFNEGQTKAIRSAVLIDSFIHSSLMERARGA